MTVLSVRLGRGGSDIDKVVAVIPDKFRLVASAAGTQITIGDYAAASVKVEGGYAYFRVIGDSVGDAFIEEMVKKHPKIDPERVLWVVLFPWHGKFTYLGESGFDSADEAKQAALTQFSPGKGAYLVSYRLKDWGENEVKVIESHRFIDNAGHADMDNTGPSTFALTNEESGPRPTGNALCRE